MAEADGSRIQRIEGSSSSSGSAASRARCVASRGWSRNERYCIDVLTQINAVQAALDKIALGLSRTGHARHCLAGDGEGPKSADNQADELMGAVGRMSEALRCNARRHDCEGRPPVMEGSLLRSRDFRLVAGSVGLSALGDWVAIVALGLHVKQTTDAGFAVAGLWICLFGPSVAVAGHAGLLVDRVEATRLLAGVSLLGAVVAAVLGFTTALAPVLVLTAMLGLVFAVLQPAEFALVPPLAGSRIQEANGHYRDGALHRVRPRPRARSLPLLPRRARAGDAGATQGRSRPLPAWRSRCVCAEAPAPGRTPGAHYGLETESHICFGTGCSHWR